MSYLLLHNGNHLVKPWAAKFYNCTVLPCLVDQWPGAVTLEQKYHQAKTSSVCTDLSTADTFNIIELADAKQAFKVVKVITSYENDLDNLEPIWNNGYAREQWLVSVFNRLSCADHIVFHQPVKLDCLQTESPIIFTPGRCGTHVLSDITRVQQFLHHNDNILMSDQFLRIINSSRVLSVLRKSVVDQVISDAITRRYGILVTNSNNLTEHQQQVASWKSFKILDSDYKSTLEKLYNYADLLIGIKMVYNKHVEFSLLEDLREQFETINSKKTPYQTQDIISNYSEVVDICNCKYQPIYDQLISKLQCIFGTTIYKHV